MKNWLKNHIYPERIYRAESWESLFLNLWRLGDTLRFDTRACDRQWYEYLKANQLAEYQRHNSPALWPLPNSFYLKADAESLDRYWLKLKDLSADKICDHLFVFDSESLILTANEFGFRGFPVELTLQNRTSLAQKKFSQLAHLKRFSPGEAL